MKKNYLILGLMFVLLSSFVSAVLDDAVSHWSMDETSGNTRFLDYNGYSNLSIAGGGAGSFGVINNGLNSSGVSYANLSSNITGKPLYATENFTYNIWIYGNNTGVNTAIIDGANSCGAQTFQFDTDGSGNLRVIGAAVYFTTSKSFLNATDWNMLTYRRTPTNVSLSINGVMRNSTGANTFAVLSGTGCIPRVGAYSPNNGVSLGKFDEFSWYNRSLSDSEVSQIYSFVKVSNLSYPYIPALGVRIITPVNGSSFFVENHNYFDVNVSATGFGGNVSTTLFLYNSTNDLLFTYFSQSNPFIKNITNLSVGTYKINATSNNYTNYNITDVNNVLNNTIYTINKTEIGNFGLYGSKGLKLFGNQTGGYAQNDFFNAINISQGFAINISIKQDSYNFSGSSSKIFTFRQIASGTDSFTITSSSSSTTPFIAQLVNSTGSAIGLTDTSFINDVWFNYRIQYNLSSANFSLLKDGILVSSVSLNTSIQPLRTSKNFKISSSYSSPLIFWNGTIDNIVLENSTGHIVAQYTFENFTGFGGFENSSLTTTASIYNLSVGSILTPVVGYNSSNRYLNLSWSNATFNPVFVSVTNTTLYLLNNDSSINRVIYNFTNGISINNYTYDLYSQNLSVGIYYIRLDQVDVNGNGRTTSNRINITTNTLLNITAKTISGAAIQNFTIRSQNSLYSLNTTSNTTNNYLEINQIRGNISLIIDAEGYSTNFSTANIQVNTPNYTYQFTLYETNTFNITFYNQANPTVLLTGINISLDLISNLYAQNYTTDNGTLYIPLLVPETYTMRYYSNGFTTRFYYFTLNNRSYEEIKLYLINSSSSYNFTVYIVNQVLNPVEGAVVKNLKYDLATNSYLVQEIGTTDVAGKTTFTVTYNNEFYKQIVEYPSGTFKKMTNPDYIDTPSVVIPISLGDNNIVEEVINYDGINGMLVFNNVTDNFRFDWSDTSLVASEYCLEVYRMTGLAKTLYNNSCESGASAGTILLGVANGSGYVYYAEATYFENSIEKYLTSLYYTYPTPDADEPLGNKYGLFIQLILTMGVTSLVVLNIGLAMILAPFSLIIGKLLGWNVFTWAGLLALQVVGIILAIISSMRR